jgi:hypothetical protein
MRRASWEDEAVSDHNLPKEAAAKAKGLVIVAPGDHELFVDIDDAASLETFKALAVVLNTFRTCSWVLTSSPSGQQDRHHATVTLEDGPPLTNLERMALQAMLGSDRLHELLSYRSHTRGDQTPTVFFEKPGLSKPNVTPLPVYES